MAADKLRQQSMLQERLKKKKEEKLRAKQDELINNADDTKRELDVRQQSKLQRMKADEVLLYSYRISLLFSFFFFLYILPDPL